VVVSGAAGAVGSLVGQIAKIKGILLLEWKDGWMDECLATSDRKSTRLNSSHPSRSRMPSSA